MNRLAEMFPKVVAQMIFDFAPCEDCAESCPVCETWFYDPHFPDPCKDNPRNTVHWTHWPGLLTKCVSCPYSDQCVQCMNECEDCKELVCYGCWTGTLCPDCAYERKLHGTDDDNDDIDNESAAKRQKT